MPQHATGCTWKHPDFDRLYAKTLPRHWILHLLLLFFVFVFFVFPEFGTNEDPAVPDVCAYICSPEMQAQWPQCAVAAAWSHISSHAMPAALHELRMLPSCMYCMTDRSVGQLPSRIITNGVK
jgi:hypothetical protein